MEKNLIKYLCELAYGVINRRHRSVRSYFNKVYNPVGLIISFECFIVLRVLLQHHLILSKK